MSDFAIRPTVYARLAKPVLAAALFHETQAMLEQALNSRCGPSAHGLSTGRGYSLLRR